MQINCWNEETRGRNKNRYRVVKERKNKSCKVYHSQFYIEVLPNDVIVEQGTWNFTARKSV